MTFLSIGFLLAGAAAVIPVLLHMIHRRALKELPFATLRFLKISEQKTRRKRRIQDLFLMLLRVAVLLLIAIGLANPVISNLSNLWGGAQASIVIIIDNSASMGMIDGSITRIETAIQSAERILDELDESGNQVAIVVTCGPDFPENGQLFTSQERVRELLRQVKVTYEKADLPAALHRSRLTLSKANTPSKMIFLISDQQKVAWAGLAAEESPNAADSLAGKTDEIAVETEEMRKIPLILVDCTSAPRPNVGIARIDLKNVIPVAQVPIPIGVRLRNDSSIVQQRRFEVFIDNQKQYTSPEIEIEAGGEARHDFTVVFQEGGIRRGEVRLVGNDGSKYDDKYYFAMKLEQGIPVALIKPAEHEIAFLEETFYLERALASGTGGVSPIRLSSLSKEELVSEPLTGYAVVILANLPAPDHETAEKLLDYVHRGGNLIWTFGDNFYADAYNELNEQLGGELLPCPVFDFISPELESERDSWSIGQLDADYPAFSNLVQPPALYRSVLVYRHVPFDVPAEFPALARLDDGTQLIVRKNLGNGTITMFGTGLHVSWTNLPLRPIFVPMINQMIFNLAGIEQTRLQTVAGVPLQMRFKPGESPQSVEIVPPSGGVMQIPLTKSGSANLKGADTQGETFIFPETSQPGIYTLRPIGGTSSEAIPFSVNIDGDEIAPEMMAESDFREKFASTPLVFAKAGESIETTFEDLKRGTSLWDMFLMIVLAVLVAEAFVSNRLSQRNTDKQPGVDVRKMLPEKPAGLSV